MRSSVRSMGINRSVSGGSVDECVLILRVFLVSIVASEQPEATHQQQTPAVQAEVDALG